MRSFLLTIGVVLGMISPVAAYAQTTATGDTLFDLFYEETHVTSSQVSPSPRVIRYVQEEMRSWGDRGVVLSVDDIDRAIAGALFQESGDGLCQNKVDTAGQAHEFVQGAATIPGSCLALQSDILALIAAEAEVAELGADLMTIANGAELAIADEPHRPLDMALLSLLLRRVWSGTGASVIPWDGSAASEFAALNDALSALEPEELGDAVLRFHHGYFRDQRENDPRFSGVQDTVGDKLSDLARTLGITGNQSALGIFATPSLRARNVALWARGDDIGLLWIYPTHAPRLRVAAAGAYPEFAENGDALAYPFSYTGDTPAEDRDSETPLCSRMIGRYGYLCRPQPASTTECENTSDGSTIALVQCSPTSSSSTQRGPSVCPEFAGIFTDTGIPLEDPANPGRLNPALTKADYAHICSPEQKVLYQDDVTSNACYIALCLAQSMSGHSLIPGRNSVVTNEASSPYLACIRPDPQLALYTEVAADSPYPLPEYLGQFLVRDFERQYCSKNADAPQALLGLCVYNDNENAALPISAQFANAQLTTQLQEASRKRGEDFTSIAASIGQRVALDQSIQLQRKMFAKLAHFIQHIADMFLELERAPLTQSACPWTGMFRSSTPAP